MSCSAVIAGKPKRLCLKPCTMKISRLDEISLLDRAPANCHSTVNFWLAGPDNILEGFFNSVFESARYVSYDMAVTAASLN